MAGTVPPSSYRRVGTASWALLASRAGSDVVVAASRAPTFGRARERRNLEAALDAAKRGHPTATVVSGLSGVGKSRLLDDAARLAAAKGFTVCSGATWQDLQSPFLTLGPSLFPLLTFDSVTERFVGDVADHEAPPDRTPGAVDEPDRNRATRNGSVRNGSDRNGSDRNGSDRNGSERNGHAVERGPAPRSILHGHTRPAVRPRDDSDVADFTGLLNAESADRGTMIETIAHDVLALAAETPLLITVDDFNWADELSRDLVHTLVTLMRHPGVVSRLCILLGGRHDAGPAMPSLADVIAEGGVDEMALEPLAARDAIELALATGVRASERGVAEHIAEGSGGNPLLIMAMARQAASRADRAARIDANPDRFESLFDVPIDGGVAGLLRQQFDELDPTSRDILIAAAVCGPVATLDRIARMVSFSEDEVEAAVAAALERSIVSSAAPISFVHPIFRQVAYTALPTLSRKLLHVRVAEDLLHEAADRHDNGPLLLLAAFHLRRAGFVAPERLVVDTCTAAAEIAFAERAWGDAARNYEAVIDVLPPLAASSPATADEGGDAPGSAGDRRVGDEAGADHDVRADRAALMLVAAQSRMHNLDLEDAAAKARDALSLFAEVGDSAGRARAIAVQHRCEIMLGRMGRRLDNSEVEAIARATADLPEQARIRALIDLSERRWMAGEVDEGLALAAEACDDARRQGDPVLLRAATVSRATCHWLRFELETARDHLAAVVGDDELHAGLPDACVVAGRLGITSWWLGDPGESVRFAVAAETIARATAQPAERIIPLATLAARAVHEANLPLAEQLIDEALSIQRLSMDRWGSAFLYPVLASGLTFAGRGGEASQLLNVWSAEIDREGGGPEAQFADLCKTWVRAWRGIRTEQDDELIDGAVRIVEILCASDVPLTLGVESYLSMHVDFADLADRADLAAVLVPALARCTERGAVIASSTGMLLRRGVGVAARVAGDHERAAVELAAAATTAKNLELPVEQALTEVELARLDVATGVSGGHDRLAAAIDGVARIGLTWRASLLGS